MKFQSKTETPRASLTAAAAALLDCYAAGIIAIAPAMLQFQRYEVERELRVDAQILTGSGADDCAVIALTAIACFRRGIETGALVVTREGAAPHIAATIAGVAGELDRTEAHDGPLASLWFDQPAVMPAA